MANNAPACGLQGGALLVGAPPDHPATIARHRARLARLTVLVATDPRSTYLAEIAERTEALERLGLAP